MQAGNMTLEIKDTKNNSKGTMNLSEAVFANKASESAVHTYVVSFLANQRQGTHATKTKGMVSGGGRKPYKQKHTGRARQGSIRSAQWRGGGIIFGPQPRDYSVNLPKSMKRAALYKALTMKLADNEIVLLDSLTIGKPKTKDMMQILKDLGLSGKSVLIVLPESDASVILSVRNIPGVDVVRVSDLNAYYVTAYNNIVFTADALKSLQESGEAV
jgi:large subunit ribosomal protein L4